MIRIEVTGDSIPEVADKLLAIGVRLRANDLQVAGLSKAEIVEWTPAPAEAAKPKPTRKAKAAEEAKPEADAGEPEASGAGATDAPQDASTETSSVTAAETAPAAAELDFDKDVAPVVLDAVAAIGKERVVGIIGEFGAARASEVSPAQWPELVERLKGEQA